VRDVSDPPSLPFLTRLWFAYVVFFRVLFNGAYAAELTRFVIPDGVQSPKALPPPAEPKKLEPAKPEPKKAEPKAPPSVDAALQLLALLQREGRFVDFLVEDVASFADADIGAAARVVHSGCRKALRDHVKLEPVRSEEEGVQVTLPEPLDGAEVKLTGNVTGKGPFTGTLRHRGWRAAEITLPTAVAGHDARILAQAEVEL
jgi:hypothetical protein